MSRFHGLRSNDEEEDEDEYDMSGFVGDQVPPTPTVVERPRAKKEEPSEDPEVDNLSYAGPTTRVRTNPASLNYAPSFLKDEFSSQSEWVKSLNPLWAHDEALVSPKLHVFLKTAGVATSMITLIPAAKSGFRGKLGTAFAVGTYAYMASASGFGHGLSHNMVGDRSGLVGGAINYGTKLGVQAGLGLLAWRLIKRA